MLDFSELSNEFTWERASSRKGGVGQLNESKIMRMTSSQLLLQLSYNFITGYREIDCFLVQGRIVITIDGTFHLNMERKSEKTEKSAANTGSGHTCN